MEVRAAAVGEEIVATTTGQPKVRQYVRPIPFDWFLRKKNYIIFMVRELVSAGLAAYALFLLVLMRQARNLPEFRDFMDVLKSPPVMLLHLVFLGCALINTVLTFGVAPRILVIRRGEEKVPEHVILGLHFIGWILTSLVILGLVAVVKI